MQTLQGQQQWRGERTLLVFRESRLDIFFTINVFLCDVKKKNLQTLINMTVRMVCVHVCVCVRASKKERKLGTYSI